MFGKIKIKNKNKNKNCKLIAFTGLRGSGKDTAADHIIHSIGEEQDIGLLVQFAFADILKNIIHEGFNLSNSDADIIKRTQIKPFNGLSLREVYQRIGEGIKTRLGQNVWVEVVITRMSEFLETVEPDLMIITDLRYTNEEAALRKFAEDAGIELFIIKLINTNQIEVDDHPSENQISDIKEDFLIKADDTNNLKSQIGEIYDSITAV